MCVREKEREMPSDRENTFMAVICHCNFKKNLSPLRECFVRNGIKTNENSNLETLPIFHMTECKTNNDSKCDMDKMCVSFT